MISILASSLVAVSAYAQEPAPPAGGGSTGGTTTGDSSATIGASATTPTDQPAAPVEAPPPEAAPKPKPPPFTPPFKLRPILPLNVVLVDTALAKYENAAGQGGLTYAQFLLGAYKITPELNIIGRVGFVQDNAPSAPNAPITASGAAFANPVVAAAYALKLDDIRLNFFLGFALPFGSGGGDPGPDQNIFAVNARQKGVPARASMDNAMFAVNDFVVFPGVGIGWIKHGFTLQAEVTYLELNRVRGEKGQLEANKRNLASGVFAGYYVHPNISLGAEFHYQRWLNPPIAVEAANKIDENARTYAQRLTAGGMDQASVAVGPRFHFKVGDVWLRPGIAYERGLDFPMSSAALNYHNVQIHIPIIFK